MPSTGADFERLVVDLLHAMGYGRGDEDRKRVTKMTGDDGIDGVIDEDRLGLDAVYIQAKNYSAEQQRRQTGPPEVRRQPRGASRLEGRVHHDLRRSRRMRSTTSSGSRKRIVLIDGQRLAALMYDYGIGVQAQAVARREERGRGLLRRRGIGSNMRADATRGS